MAGRASRFPGCPVRNACSMKIRGMGAFSTRVVLITAAGLQSGANQRSGGKAGWWRKPAASREVRPKGSALKGNRGLTIGRKSGEAAIGGTRGWIAQQTEAWRKRRKPEVSSRSLSGEIEQPAQAGGETNRDNRQSWHQAQAKGRKSRGK